ncbi:MAG: glycoside hydrolase family 3 protein, partial [Firmicutes bacterium]|nr:glycoside hydrolase family 3 protein [Bacillota bacterium]
MKKIMAVLCMVIAAALFAGCGPISDKKASDNMKNTASADSESSGNIEAEILKNDRAEKIVSQMTTDEKISQMIIPAIRTWEGENVTDLDAFPELKSALQAHQYGGIILFGANITGTAQTAELVHELQLNNFLIPDVSAHIPYFMPLDQEGGRVIRLVSGTRMTGNMAIGATGAKSEENAEKTGQIIGEELSALGFNVDYAPVVDVNNNPSNPVIGIRSFSDDPETVARL